MSEIQIFNNPDFGEIRTIIIDGEPWFVAKDIAEKLGYAKTFNMTKQIDDEDKQIFDCSSQEDTNFNAKARRIGIINESGLYTAIMGSQMKNAKLFKRWVTKDVLPSIRKTGTYGQPQLPDNPMEMLKIHCAALEQVDKKVDAVDGKVGQLKSRITDLEDTMMLDHGQEYYLEKTVNKTVISALGGKESNAYKQIGRKVFAECNGDLKAYFKVNARGNIPRKRYEEAVKYAENWKPCMNTQMLIDQHNAQQRLEM